MSEFTGFTCLHLEDCHPHTSVTTEIIIQVDTPEGTKPKPGMVGRCLSLKSLGGECTHDCTGEIEIITRRWIIADFMPVSPIRDESPCKSPKII